LKKTVSILLLFCLLFNVVGYYIVFHIRRAEIKDEMKKTLRENIYNQDQEILCFSLNDKAAISKLEWEDDHEFRLDGKMYDVIEKKVENGKLIIRCISDEKETALVKKFEQINNEKGANSKGKAALLIKLIGNTYLVAFVTDLPVENPALIPRPYFNINIITPLRSDVLTPPPQIS
jgi:hypothetical protein